MTPATSIAATQTVELRPSYTLALVLVIAGLALTFLVWWIGLPIALFGLFLLFQTVSLRLQFSPTDLDIYRGETLIRRFPYAEWQNWQIFWPSVPILFYFKEVNSIHFLPILFDPEMLRVCLEQRCPKLARN